MGFASQVTDTVPLSNGTDTVVIRKLGWKAQQAARDETQRKALAAVTSLGAGFVDVQQAIRKALDANGGADAIKKAVEADPFLQFDKGVLLERGIVSWSLSDKPTTAEMDELAPEDADLLARRIYDLFRPATEEERKNG